MSHGSAHHIVHDVLQFHELSTRWVPRELTAELKERRVDACHGLLKRFETEGDGFLGRIITGNKTWVYRHQPETKKANKEWRRSSSSNPKNSAHNHLRERLCWLFLGWMSGNFGALNTQGGHCDQCNVCKSPKESPASCTQVQTTWTSEYRCFAPTWQCWAPYCQLNCCNNPRSVLRTSSTSAVLARPRPHWLSCL